MSFEGRTAIITGGASGIEIAIARQLAKLGAKIAITDTLCGSKRYCREMASCEEAKFYP